MFDPYMTPILSEHRRFALLAEAERDRLVASARAAAGAPAAARPERRPAWRPALFQLGAWLVGIGRRLQATAEPRVLAA